MADMVPGDSLLNPVFKTLPVFNETKSKETKRPFYDTLEVVELSFPGDRERRSVFPANAESGVFETPDGTTRKFTYAERFADQYDRFKAEKKQGVSGTPLEVIFDAGEVKTFNAQNIYTVEQLASLEGSYLKSLGQDGRSHKNKAQGYLESADARGSDALASENEALKTRIAELEASTASTTAPAKPKADEQPREDPKSPFDAFDDKEIREWIEAKTGEDVDGRTGRKKLIAKADEVNATLSDSDKVA